MKTCYAIVGLCILLSCQRAPSGEAQTEGEPVQTVEQTDLQGKFAFGWQQMAEKVVSQAKIQPGERVVLVGTPGEFDPLVRLIRTKVAGLGGEDLGAISVSTSRPRDWETDFTRGAQTLTGDALDAYFQDIDLGIMMPGAVPTDAPYKAIQNVLTGGSIRTIHFHWTGAYGLDMTPLEVDDRINTVYQYALLNTDYDRLGKIQQLLEREMRASWTTVTTPSGTNIKFQIGDRPVTKQDGDASAIRARKAKNLIDREIELPAGAVRVAPVESTVSGTIRFPDSDWNGTQVEGLKMTFEKGRVTNWSAQSGRDAVRAELDSGGQAALQFREFALGLNPLLEIPGDNPWIPYYGYGAGVVRLSLGDNTELGGNVGGGYVRWNFFTDATVKVGEEIWVRDGRLSVQ